MKNKYQKYIKQVWEMKEKTYDDFKKSGLETYVDFIKNDIKDIKINYKNGKKFAA